MMSIHGKNYSKTSFKLIKKVDGSFVTYSDLQLMKLDI